MIVNMILIFSLCRWAGFIYEDVKFIPAGGSYSGNSHPKHKSAFRKHLAFCNSVSIRIGSQCRPLQAAPASNPGKVRCDIIVGYPETLFLLPVLFPQGGRLNHLPESYEPENGGINHPADLSPSDMSVDWGDSATRL